MTTATQTQLRRGYRTIDQFSNYAINRSGTVYNINTGRDISVTRGSKVHWSGRVGLVNDYGTREWYNIAELVSETFGISNENTLRRSLSSN